MEHTEIKSSFEAAELANLNGGAAMERFKVELERVIRNIADPNTDPEAKRAINLRVTFTPREDRQRSEIAIECTARLAPYRPVKGDIVINLSGRPEAHVQKVEQKNLFDNVVNLPEKPVGA